ncbi:MAG: hypothetical protein N3I35_18460 [Clostridia bacterium]|nr:hypothetical protein [Clostridia bacterium]
MGAFKNISNELKTFFSNHSFFKILLPLDIILLIGGLGVMILNEFISVGSLLYSIAYYIFLLGLLLTYAGFNQKMLYIGFFTYGIIQVINVFQGLLASYGYMNYHALLTALIFGWIGYLIFKRSTAPVKQ